MTQPAPQKALITAARLVDAINIGLQKDWKHKDHHCRVIGLKRVNYPERNWEVESYGTGGKDLMRSTECQQLLDRILNELVTKYDVIWPD